MENFIYGGGKIFPLRYNFKMRFIMLPYRGGGRRRGINMEQKGMMMGEDRRGWGELFFVENEKVKKKKI
jgi:hypothetical protein